MAKPRFLLACVLALASCRRAAPMPDVFSAAVGAWQRISVSELPPGGAAIERILAASYQGPGKLDARVYQLASPALALDMAQRWKPAPDTVFFYKDRFFVWIQWQTADRQALREFVAALERKFPADAREAGGN
jgi:hypothetical protein